jgi:hypothetical protein
MSNPDVLNGPNTLTLEVNNGKQPTEEVAAISMPEVNSPGNTVTVRTASTPMKLEALTSLVKDKLKPDLDEPLQEEIAALLNLIPELDNSYQERFIPLVEIAALSLLSETPNITLAKRIREGIEQSVHRSPLAAVVRGRGSPPTRVILGLGTLLYFFIPLLIILLGALTGNDIFGIRSSPLTPVAIAGAVGSVVSIMIRIQDFESFRNSDPSLSFFTGFFKPIIGTAFALFVFMTLNSGLIPVTVRTTNSQCFFMALAFVSGFSERFAKDIATRAEETIVAVTSTKL